jgi:hypothetical protein
MFNNKVSDVGFYCPYMKPKEWAKLPMACWLLLIGFLTMYTLGRMITILGRRICE